MQCNFELKLETIPI